MSGLDQRMHDLVRLLRLRRRLYPPAVELAVAVDGSYTKMSTTEIRGEDQLRRFYSVNGQLLVEPFRIVLWLRLESPYYVLV